MAFLVEPKTLRPEAGICYTLRCIRSTDGGMKSMKKQLCFLLAFLFTFGIALSGGESALSSSAPVTAEEIDALFDRLLESAGSLSPLNDPASEDALSEDGYAMEYYFGTLYASSPSPGDGEIGVISVTLENFPTLRDLVLYTEIDRIMEKFPCDNPEMDGTDAGAVLYLQGDPASGFCYGRVARDHQQLTSLEFGVWQPADKRLLSATLLLSFYSLDAVRLERREAPAERAEELYGELRELLGQRWYPQARWSRDVSSLEMFSEEDLDFLSLSYRTAQPEQFGSNVEGLMIDNHDGTWLLRLSGKGFEAVFSCEDDRGKNPVMISFTFLSAEWEGPRGVRLGDSFQDDFYRFRSGEGSLNEEKMTEVLYGTPGIAPWAEAAYESTGDIDLKYVAKVPGPGDVGLYLHYEDTVLTEMMLITLEDPE